MEPLHSVLPVFISAFLAILFLQSGIDKAVDWKGNSAYHTTQFANTPLRKLTMPMLFMLTMMEIGCGITSLAGIIFYFLNGTTTISFYAACFASLILLCLFFGLRISKDYRGAAGLVPYFIVALLGIYFSS